jgi:hypothetical protein
MGAPPPPQPLAVPCVPCAQLEASERDDPVIACLLEEMGHGRIDRFMQTRYFVVDDVGPA